MRKPPHRGPRRRPLGHGDLPLLLLSLLAEAPRHGYDLITAIEARTDGAYKPSPGVIYPALEVLQDQGLIRMVPDGAKKSYAVTEDGQARLTDEAEALAHIDARLDGLGRADAPPAEGDVRAAMQRLHHTVRSHMRGRDVPEDERARIATMVDDLRRTIAALGDD